jgi:hypothetical protein
MQRPTPIPLRPDRAALQDQAMRSFARAAMAAGLAAMDRTVLLSDYPSVIKGHPNEYVERPIRLYSASLVRVGPGHSACPDRLWRKPIPRVTLRKRILLFALWRSKEVSCLTIGVVCQHARAAHERATYQSLRSRCGGARAAGWQAETPELRLEVV